MSILIFIIILLGLVIIHEFGHFSAAKKMGIRVDEFGVGFPPRLFGWKRGETLYSVNAIPFGGFVKIYGENKGDVIADDTERARAFSSKSRGAQAFVLVMGVVFNFLAAWLLLSVGFMIGFPSALENGNNLGDIHDARFMITGVSPSSPADTASLRAGDAIVSISDDEEVLDVLTPLSVRSFVSEREGESIRIAYVRDDVQAEAVVIPEELVEGEGAMIGVSLGTVGTLRLPVHRALYEGLVLTGRLSKEVAVSFFTLIKGAFTGEASLDELAGPVGIVGVVGDAARLGFVSILSLAALISINLAILNLIPFPALDGGRLFFLLIEKIRGKALPPQIENGANLIGFALLIILMLVVTYKDIIRLF